MQARPLRCPVQGTAAAVEGIAAAVKAASGDVDEVNTASDSTEGLPEDRWTVVGTRKGTSPAAVATLEQPPPPCEASATPTKPIVSSGEEASAESQEAATAVSAVAGVPAASPVVTSPVVTSHVAAEAGADEGSPGSAATSDDDLADVDAGEGGPGSEVDEDWGAWD